MKYAIIIIILFIHFEIMAKQISDFNWEKRIVIISFEKKEDQIFLFTQKFVSENKCSINDRNLEFIYFYLHLFLHLL